MRMMTQCESYFLSTSFFNTYLSIGALLQESSGHQWPRGSLRASLLGQALLPPHLLSKIGVSTLLKDKNIDFTLPDKDFLLGHLPYGTVEYKWRRVGSGRAGKSLTYWWRAGGDQRRWNQCITTCLSHPWYLWPGGLVVRDNMLLLRSTCGIATRPTSVMVGGEQTYYIHLCIVTRRLCLFLYTGGCASQNCTQVVHSCTLPVSALIWSKLVIKDRGW